MLLRVRERWVHFPARTVFTVVAIIIAVAAVLKVVYVSRHVLTWIFVALFLALALNPLVELLQRRGIRRRGLAAGAAYLLVLIAIAGIGALFVPIVVHQTNQFVDKVPDYVDDLTSGRGRLGFLQTKYHVVDKVRESLHGNGGGAKKLLGLSGTAVSLTKSIITAIVAIVTIAFMTFFMILEGPAWVERGLSLAPTESRERWRRIAYDIYRTVGGYVTGNLLISLIAGAATTIVLVATGVPFAIALGLIVAILDLIPLAGATLAAIIVGLVAFLHSIVAGIVVVVFFIVYQQIENHLLQPVVYGRTVQLSPLAVLISVLIGAELAGILGALAAIPVAGAIQVLLVDWNTMRRAKLVEPAAPAAE